MQTRVQAAQVLIRRRFGSSVVPVLLVSLPSASQTFVFLRPLVTYSLLSLFACARARKSEPYLIIGLPFVSVCVCVKPLESQAVR